MGGGIEDWSRISALWLDTPSWIILQCFPFWIIILQMLIYNESPTTIYYGFVFLFKLFLHVSDSEKRVFNISTHLRFDSNNAFMVLYIKGPSLKVVGWLRLTFLYILYFFLDGGITNWILRLGDFLLNELGLYLRV